MKLRIYTIACTVLVALGCLCACQEDFDNGPLAGDENTWVLNLEATAIQASRSAGQDEYYENKVASADVFFFTEDNGECIYAQTGLVPDGTQLRVTLDNEKVKFGGRYFVYVIANGRAYYTGIDNKTAVGKTVADLKDVTIRTTWKDGYEESNGEIEESLLMDGADKVLISQNTPGKVKLTRAMAKVALFPTVEASVISEARVEYTPVLKDMTVTMVYGVQATNLGDDYAVQTTEYVDRIRRHYQVSENAYTGVHPPFYSYPNPESTVDRKNTYLILCVPWRMKSESGDVQAANYYYRVPIAGKDDVPVLLERNHYYKVNVHVGVLGSLNPRDAVELTGNFAIYDWFDMEISADMQHYKYLVLDEYSSVMNNVNELRMPYVSSSALMTNETRITKVTYPNYNAKTDDDSHTDTVELDTPQAIRNAGFLLSWDDDELIFTHPVTTEDYVPYTITVEVWNEQGLDATWEITQYPAIYIVGDYNPDGANNRFVYGVSSGPVYDDYKGSWPFSNGNTLGGVNNPLVNATNKNLNQYTIYITSFDIAGSNYAIGDPRSSTVDNLDFLNKEINEETLSYYYPTRKDDVQNVIAPAFKIASSWGVVDANSLTYETAKRRCASYQENGYPAGRWRVPTEAEIQYIVSLSDRGVIPVLFGGDYYASSGRYYDNESSPAGFHDDSRGGHAVRCVYDVWYWGNEKMSEKDGSDTQFVWGDEPMR